MCNIQFQFLKYTSIKISTYLDFPHDCLNALITYLKISCTSKYQLKFGKCFEYFVLDMKVYVGVQ
jgi:hypothetical protein